MIMLNNQDKNNSSVGLSALRKVLQKKVAVRIILVALTLVLTLVLVFALTIAWQTNIVQTGGLMFSSETWNFSGNVLIESQFGSVAPGDDGVIGIQMENDSADLVAASVTVSKDNLIPSMCSRMYFYIDTSTTRNGENLPKVYVSRYNSYTYILFPYSNLQIDENSNRDPVLKWEWVYDNLGYYVLGKPNSDGSFQIDDYIRPIEYDYDPMGTTFDPSTGKPISVEGKSALEFLKEFSSSDGYSGRIETEHSSGYYPVSVDGSDYGVWAYLCTQQEIEQGTFDDTLLGQSGASLGSASVVVTGWNSREDGIPVYNESSLIQALNSSDFQHITLTRDITLTQTMNLDASSQTMIDLNGQTLSSSADTIISAEEGAAVLIQNGSLVGSGDTKHGLKSVGASITLDHVEIRDVEEGIAVFDNQSSLGLDSSLRLVDSKIIGELDGLWIYGNGNTSEKNTTIVIENSEVFGEKYIGILCNGTYFGTDIQVKNSTVKGSYAAIYFPQKDSLLTVDKSTLEGGTALAVKGGTVKVIDSTVAGIGDYRSTPLPDDPSKLSMSGYWDTGDGIYLEANYPDMKPSITVEGAATRVTSAYGKSVRLYPTADGAKISISAGTYSSDVTEYLAPGCTVSKNGDNEFVVGQ